jgi:tetratricopeptide (TPR) repeat protein
MKILLIALVIALTPQSSEEYFGLGLNAYNKGNYGEAALLFTKAVEADTTSISARFNRATAYLRLQRYGDALNDLNWCISRQPDRIAHRMQRAVIHAETGNTQQALVDLELVIGADSLFPRARLLRGRLLMNSDPARACADLRAAMAAGDASAERFVRELCN